MRDGLDRTVHGRRGAAFCASLAAGALAAAAADALSAPPAPPVVPRDAMLVVRFAGAAPLRRARSGGLELVSSGGTQAYGTITAGRPLVDPVTGRTVVVRPEALREFFVLSQEMTRQDADDAAALLLRRVERTGDLSPLDDVTASLRARLGASAGVRLDDPTTTDFFPPSDPSPEPTFGLRQMIAGDDAMWRAYGGGDVNAFSQLASDARFERFHHPVDPATGVPSPNSVLRIREHRRVLFRRTAKAITFVPTIPLRADPTDRGLEAGATYSATASGAVRRLARDVLTPAGAARFVRGVATIETAPDTGESPPFAGEAPRVVNVTPPIGESFLDTNSDWEDPDNLFVTPVAFRRPFVIRVRFSRPLDPRTVDAAHFSLRPAGSPSGPPVVVNVSLAQRALGDVVVEVRPVTNLDPQTLYRLHVDKGVRGLDGRALGMAFDTGP